MNLLLRHVCWFIITNVDIGNLPYIKLMLVCAFFISNLSSSELQKFNTHLHHKPDIYSYCIQGNIRIRCFFSPLSPSLSKGEFKTIAMAQITSLKIYITSSRRIQDVANPLPILKKSENNTERKQPCIQYFFRVMSVYI